MPVALPEARLAVRAASECVRRARLPDRPFVAPSFEAIVYRVWLENQIRHIEHADYLRRQGETPPSLTPAIQASIDHYRVLNGARNL